MTRLIRSVAAYLYEDKTVWIAVIIFALTVGFITGLGIYFYCRYIMMKGSY